MNQIKEGWPSIQFLKPDSLEISFIKAWEEAHSMNWRHPADAMRVFISKALQETKQRVTEEWMNKYETDVDLTAKQVERRVARDITKEIDTFISQWLRNYANIPLKKRRDAFYEVADLRKVLLSKLDTNNIDE